MQWRIASSQTQQRGLWSQLLKTLKQEDSWNAGVYGQPEQHNEALISEKEIAPAAHVWEYHNETQFF